MAGSDKQKHNNSTHWAPLIMGLMLFSLGGVWLSDYRELGYINTARYAFVPTYGPLALFVCYLCLSVGGFLILWSGKQLLHKGKHPRPMEVAAGARPDKPDSST